MTFLQPWVLAALPLVALPLVIHLINQRRFQTMPWAAMMFLASARALSRGYSRLRHWLIMILRMAAVAAVILAVGRPLSRGWLALAGGGRPDTAVVILDRSPSMLQRGSGDEAKLDAGRRRLAATLTTLAPNRCVLVADAERPPLELARPADLADEAGSPPHAAPADILRMLQLAYDHVRENAAGSTEVWICSDQRSNDWALDAGGWGSLRDAFAKLPQQVRFQLLADPLPAAGNVAVRVTSARLETRGAGRDLLVTVAVSRQEEATRVTLPLKFEIGGATTVVNLELAGRDAVLKNHAIPPGVAARRRESRRQRVLLRVRRARGPAGAGRGRGSCRPPRARTRGRDTARQKRACPGRRGRPGEPGRRRLGRGGRAALAGRSAHGTGCGTRGGVRGPRRSGDLLSARGSHAGAVVRRLGVGGMDGPRAAGPAAVLAERSGIARQHAFRRRAAAG
jgi:hypothetical protein